MKGRSMLELTQSGVDVDHGVFRKGRSFTTELKESEAIHLMAAGWKVKVLVEDLQAYLFAQSQLPKLEQRSGQPCAGSGLPDIGPDPDFYTPGSMNGFYTYEEMLEALDEMQLRYPNLISTRKTMGTYNTAEGRPITWVQISDKPEQQESNEPEILFTALHHAREPISLTQMSWYMWYILENYSKNPEIKYLLDNTGQYFVPCLNPDGYVFNEEQFPDQLGMWRKNLRNNQDGSFGVDLNRNYSLGWGIDNFGSSPDPESITYRGPFDASEPEVQALMDFSIDHSFQIALNYHSFGNLLLYPWGYLNEETVDSSTFRNMARELNETNVLESGLPLNLLGYPVNGQSDDWLYGNNLSSVKTFAFTPEVGNDLDGFWPPEERIIPLNRQCLPLNLNAVRSLLNEAKLVYDDGPILVDELDQELNFHIRKIGLKSGSFTLTMTSPDPYVEIIDGPKNFNLPNYQGADDQFKFRLKTPFSYGDSVHLSIAVNNGTFTRIETITRLISKADAFFDPAAVTSFVNWTLNDVAEWQLTTETYYSAPSSFTDSPDGPYESNEERVMTLLLPQDLSQAKNAELVFNAKWDIETDFDYAQVEASADGINYEPLCGHYTKLGAETQDLDQPLYDGVQSSWVQEHMDLSDYVGGPVYIRYRMISDAIEQRDGIYVDDIYIIQYGDKTLQTKSIDPKEFSVTQFPNPAVDEITFQFASGLSKGSQIKIYSVEGKLVKNLSINDTRASLKLATTDLQNGLYFYQILNDRIEATGSGNFVVAHK
ncbi:MAG: M14 family zinc carboxypeptidase [Saprospiraceae bacterium]